MSLLGVLNSHAVKDASAEELVPVAASMRMRLLQVIGEVRVSITMLGCRVGNPNLATSGCLSCIRQKVLEVPHDVLIRLVN